MLSVVTWKWKRNGVNLFGPEYVNRLRSMLERHLHLPHELICITDDSVGIDKRVRIVKMPQELANTARCRRRMWQYSRDRIADFGPRALLIDLDVVIVDDITPLVDRQEPIVCWRVGYAGVYSGSFQLCDTGFLDSAWQRYKDTPDAFIQATGEIYGSDQAMLNLHLRGIRVAEWTEADGLVTWFGNGYAHKEHHGMGPGRTELPKGARVVVLGSADKHIMDEGKLPFVREHWH